MNFNTYLDKSFWISFAPFICFMLYATAGPIIPQQSFISYSLLGVFCACSFYSMYKMRWDHVSKMILLFVIVQFLYYLFAPSIVHSQLGGYKETKGKISAIVINFLPFFLAFFYSSKGKFTKQHLILYSCLFLILLIPKFIYERLQFIEAFASIGRIKEDVTVNVGYMFLELLIFLPLLRTKKILTIIVLIVTGFFILYSAKRGGILIYFIALALYIPWWLKKSKRVSIILFLAILVIGYAAIEYFSEDIYLMERLENTKAGNMSHRDEIYSDIWDYCMKSHFEIDKFLFGFGFMSSYKMTVNVAHNDWLELLSSCGLLGISLYLLYFYSLVKSYFTIQDRDSRKCLQLLIVVWFVKTFFSMAYTSLWYLPLLLGFILGNNQLYLRNLLILNKKKRYEKD